MRQCSGMFPENYVQVIRTRRSTVASGTSSLNDGASLEATAKSDLRGDPSVGLRHRRYRVGLTVTLKDAFAVFALESVAEHVTTVRPIGNRLPDRRVQVTGT
jgi:hypothetical protein